MDRKLSPEKRKQVLMGLYSSSQSISTIALIIVAVFEILMIIYSYINTELYGPYLTKYRIFYFSLLALAVIYLIINTYAKENIEQRYKILGAANIISAIFLFAWALSITYSDSLVTGVVESSVFMTFSMVVPLSFTLIPSIYAIIVVAADSVLLYLIISVMGVNVSLINVVIFFAFQFVLGIGFLKLKLNLSERIVQEEENARLDVMTNLPNRRVYEEDLKKLGEESLPSDLKYVVVDINGLKEVNDGYGHETGDKVIAGAAICIQQCFKDCGKQYRVGGDEFVVILNAEKEKLNELLKEVKNTTDDWSKANGAPLSISCGFASASDFPGCSINKLAREADDKMYEDKYEYYKSIGIDRRRYRSN